MNKSNDNTANVHCISAISLLWKPTIRVQSLLVEVFAGEAAETGLILWSFIRSLSFASESRYKWFLVVSVSRPSVAVALLLSHYVIRDM